MKGILLKYDSLYDLFSYGYDNLIKVINTRNIYYCPNTERLFEATSIKGDMCSYKIVYLSELRTGITNIIKLPLKHKKELIAKYNIWRRQSLKNNEDVTLSIIRRVLLKTNPIENIYKGYDYIVVHYPEIILRNSTDNFHILQDVFVRYTFIYGEGVVVDVARTTFNYVEIDAYLHSHLYNTSQCTWNRITSFCLGKSPLYNRKYTKELYELKLLPSLVYAVLEWESLEGGPYHKIKALQDKIVKYIPIDKSTYCIETIYIQLLKHLSESSNTLLYDECNVSLHPAIIEFFLLANYTNDDNIVGYFNTEQYKCSIELSYTSEEVINITSYSPNSLNVVPGVEIPLKVTDFNYTPSKIILPKVNPIIIEKLSNKLNKDINNIIPVTTVRYDEAL